MDFLGYVLKMQIFRGSLHLFSLDFLEVKLKRYGFSWTYQKFCGFSEGTIPRKVDSSTPLYGLKLAQAIGVKSRNGFNRIHKRKMCHKKINYSIVLLDVTQLTTEFLDKRGAWGLRYGSFLFHPKSFILEENVK